MQHVPNAIVAYRCDACGDFAWTTWRSTRRSFMNHRVKTIIGVAGLVIAAQASAQVTFFERDGLSGRSFRADGMIDNFARTGFNDRASSAVVEGGAWQAWEDAGFNGRCVMLRPGQYPDLGAI